MANVSEIVPFTLTTLWVDEYRVLMISTNCGGMPIVLRMFQRDLRSRESKAALRSMETAYSGWRYSCRRSAGSLSATIRSSVDRPGVKPLCCGRCFAKIVLFIRARHMWAKTLAGTDRSDIPRYLVQSDF